MYSFNIYFWCWLRW